MTASHREPMDLAGEFLFDMEMLPRLTGERQAGNRHELHLCTDGTVTALLPHTAYRANGAEGYALSFSYRTVAGLWEQASDDLLRMFGGTTNPVQFLLSDGQTQQALQLCKKCCAYRCSREKTARILGCTQFFQLLLLLSQAYGQAEKKTACPVVQYCLTMIQKEFRQIGSLAQIADRLHISQSYLSRLFRKQMGESVHDYLLTVRFTHAADALQRGDSVQQACADAGFCNYSYFIQTFKKRYGVTPRQYQKDFFAQQQ